METIIFGPAQTDTSYTRMAGATPPCPATEDVGDESHQEPDDTTCSPAADVPPLATGHSSILVDACGGKGRCFSHAPPHYDIHVENK